MNRLTGSSQVHITFDECEEIYDRREGHHEELLRKGRAGISASRVVPEMERM